MTLPSPNLDDLRFQSDLVDEARKRIIHYCPEWTEYNLSDPGITIIELFAWMTELMTYRLNRVPEKNYIKFLEMLGLQRMPASSARTELTFWLSIALEYAENFQTVSVPQGFEVRAEQNEEEIIFTTMQELTMTPPRLAHIRKEGEFNRNFFPRMGLETFYAFSQPAPKLGDTFYLGFDSANNIRGHTLQLDFTCDPTEAVGIRREDPPWQWECLNADGTWQPLKPSTFEGERDTTGGLNNEHGSLALYLPLNFAPAAQYGLEAFWLRCRIEQRNPLQGMYSESPRLKRVEARTIGATVPAMHATRVDGEVLGSSNGEPGQSFSLGNAPVLALQPGENLEVEETRGEGTVFVPWQQVDDFSKSTRFDRHYVLDMVNGTVHFGPSVRQPDGSVVQYGRVPESGRGIRFSRYRAGGGARGNLPTRTLTTMTTSLAYVARVANLVRADGGRDQESMEELKLRAQRELQAQRRAVTAQDYEQFTINFSRAIARAKCLTPNDNPRGGSSSVSVLVVPAVAEAIRAGGLGTLTLDETLQTDLREHLDQYRLLTTPLNVREPRYYGVKVKARIVPKDFTPASEALAQVDAELRRFLAPIRLDERAPILQPDESWDGWPFGRDLFVAEIISLIQQIPTVKFVLDVEVSYRDLIPAEENSIFENEDEAPLKPIQKILRIPPDGLVCSLEHEIEVTSMDEAYAKGVTE
jgi:predicted phage baseplate assembly protein